jgi:hypothetical protein
MTSRPCDRSPKTAALPDSVSQSHRKGLHCDPTAPETATVRVSRLRPKHHWQPKD